MLRSRGHEVRTAWRLTSELEAWAQVIIRFAPYPGPPDREEASWYHEWLENQPERSLVYIVRDYDAEPEYWSLAAQRLGEPGAEGRRAGRGQPATRPRTGSIGSHPRRTSRPTPRNGSR